MSTSLSRVIASHETPVASSESMTVSDGKGLRKEPGNSGLLSYVYHTKTLVMGLPLLSKYALKPQRQLCVRL